MAVKATLLGLILAASLATAASIPRQGVPITELTSHPELLSSSRDPSTLSRRAYADTSNQLTDGTPCRNVTVIYARGTTQHGNIGRVGDVGPLFMNNLSQIIGADALAIQGVDYDADIPGFLEGGDEDGSQTMANLTTLAHTQCPQTKIVLCGYSQGGQLVHNAADLLQTSQPVVDQVAAALIFGDPDNGDPVGSVPASKVQVICHKGDNICAGGILVLPTHLDYQKDAMTGAQLVASMVK